MIKRWIVTLVLAAVLAVLVAFNLLRKRLQFGEISIARWGALEAYAGVLHE